MAEYEITKGTAEQYRIESAHLYPPADRRDHLDIRYILRPANRQIPYKIYGFVSINCEDRAVAYSYCTPGATMSQSAKKFIRTVLQKISNRMVEEIG